ncbi:hypothetical protein B0A50_06917 [Salinomyces thailandicus]|uniref:Uncharacterized protein n=1 Tax=Salinomyces thailandicus TaxID=706561 RepID=A0A4U0TQ75_9PEZI|nr:hypothetical protein B0A50_06917 [Salinomyces thailandica]
MPCLTKPLLDHNFSGSSFVWQEFKSNPALSVFGLPLLILDLLLLPVRAAVAREGEEASHNSDCDYERGRVDKEGAKEKGKKSKKIKKVERRRGEGRGTRRKNTSGEKGRERRTLYPSWNLPNQGFSEKKRREGLHGTESYERGPRYRGGERGGSHEHFVADERPARSNLPSSRPSRSTKTEESGSRRRQPHDLRRQSRGEAPPPASSSRSRSRPEPRDSQSKPNHRTHDRNRSNAPQPLHVICEERSEKDSQSTNTGNGSDRKIMKWVSGIRGDGNAGPSEVGRKEKGSGVRRGEVGHWESVSQASYASSTE